MKKLSQRTKNSPNSPNNLQIQNKRLKFLPTALKDTFIVFLAYIPLGMGFGLLASSQLNFSIFEIFLCALIIFAGSGQYALIGMLSVNTHIIMICLGTLLINFRHFFYTLTLLTELKNYKNPLKFYMMFGLTDETFAIFCAKKYENYQKLIITALNHFYWILGCVLGGFIGKTIEIYGLDFVLIAFFGVLAINMIKTTPKPTIFASIIIAILGLTFISKDFLLLFCLFSGLLFLMIFYKLSQRKNLGK